MLLLVAFAQFNIGTIFVKRVLLILGKSVIIIVCYYSMIEEVLSVLFVLLQQHGIFFPAFVVCVYVVSAEVSMKIHCVIVATHKMYLKCRALVCTVLHHEKARVNPCVAKYMYALSYC